MLLQLKLAEFMKQYRPEQSEHEGQPREHGINAMPGHPMHGRNPDEKQNEGCVQIDINPCKFTEFPGPLHTASLFRRRNSAPPLADALAIPFPNTTVEADNRQTVDWPCTFVMRPQFTILFVTISQ